MKEVIATARNIALVVEGDEAATKAVAGELQLPEKEPTGP